MLLIGIFSHLREIQVQPVQQDLPVLMDLQVQQGLPAQPDLRAQTGLTVQMVLPAQRVLRLDSERLLLLPDLSVLLLPVQIPQKYLHLVFRLARQVLPVLMVQQDLQVLPVLRVVMVQTGLTVLQGRPVLRLVLEHLLLPQGQLV